MNPRFKVGAVFKTTDGKEARITEIQPSDPLWPIRGTLEISGKVYPTAWSATGKWRPRDSDPHDLIL